MSHDEAAELLTVVIAGGSGTLGRALARDLTARGHRVVVLTRTPQPSAATPWRQVAWDARTPGAWVSELVDAERPVAVVNLAGRLVDCRPTAANIAELRASRVDATAALVAAAATTKRPIQRWLQASSTAIYSDAGEQRITESSPIPVGLPQMTGVAQPWEQAAQGARTDHLVVLRTSLVLDRGTPLLDRLLLLARLGVGGPVGGGQQWVSWIHVEDWLGVARACLGLTPGVEIPEGPLIAASDNPVRNRELMAAVRRAAGIRFGLPTPRLLAQAGAVLLRTDPALALTGRHCTSQILRERGWTYAHPYLDDALHDLLR